MSSNTIKRLIRVGDAVTCLRPVQAESGVVFNPGDLGQVAVKGSDSLYVDFVQQDVEHRVELGYDNARMLPHMSDAKTVADELERTRQRARQDRVSKPEDWQKELANEFAAADTLSTSAGDRANTPAGQTDTHCTRVS